MSAITFICDCPRASHEHGVYATYVVHRCRCDDCRMAARDRRRARARQQLYGRYHLTNAEPARQHVRALMAAGMGWKRVAKAAGVSPSSVYPLLYGVGGEDPRPPRKKIGRDLEAKLLAVELDLAEGAIIDSLGSLRRLRALTAIGWSQRRLAPMLGMSYQNFGAVINARRKGILASTAHRVARLFDELWDQVPPTASQHEADGVRRARASALAKGWVPAAAWDDIDDPTEEPKLGEPDELTGREARTRDRFDRLELLIAEGYGDDDATFQQAGFTNRATAWKLAQRHDRTGLFDRLRANDRARGIAS